jgi:hypothetical protein
MWSVCCLRLGSAARQAAPALIAVVCLGCPGGCRRWDRVAWRGLWARAPIRYTRYRTGMVAVYRGGLPAGSKAAENR